MTAPDEAVPETDDEWFALIEPAIDVVPDDADSDAVCHIANQHIEQVVERVDIAINPSLITIEASRKLTARHGYAKGNFVKVSLHTLSTNGWQHLMQTVRHELIHIWQYQTRREGGHGESFERWMPVLNVSKRGGRVLPIWTIHCPVCDECVYQTRHELEVARRCHENDEILLHCEECNSPVDDGVVKRDGNPVDPASLRSVAMPSDRQSHVFLFNAGTTARRPHVEWNPETITLTRLPGIGDVTAERIGDELLLIEDLLADGDLAPQVRDAVPHHHDALREAVRDRYEEAQTHRSGDDLDMLQRVIDEEPVGWWQPVEAIGDTGPVETVCRSLRDTVSSGTRVTITFADIDEAFQATVFENASWLDRLQLHLQFDRVVGDYGGEGKLVSQRSSYWDIPSVQFVPLDDSSFHFFPDELTIERIDVADGIVWTRDSDSDCVQGTP